MRNFLRSAIILAAAIFMFFVPIKADAATSVNICEVNGGTDTLTIHSVVNSQIDDKERTFRLNTYLFYNDGYSTKRKCKIESLNFGQVTNKDVYTTIHTYDFEDFDPVSGKYTITCELERTRTYYGDSNNTRLASDSVDKYVLYTSNKVYVSDENLFPSISISDVSVVNNTIRIVSVVNTFDDSIEYSVRSSICSKTDSGYNTVTVSPYASSYSSTFKNGRNLSIITTISEANFYPDSQLKDMSSGYYYVYCDLCKADGSQYQVSALYNKKYSISTNVKKYFMIHKGTVTIGDDEIPEPKEIELSVEKKNLTVGKKTTIKLLNSPSKKIKWSVSNKKIKILKTKNNKVTILGVKKGKAILRAKVKGKTYKCTITVKNPSKKKNNGTKYVLNTSTMKFHYPSCKDVKKIKADNYEESDDSRSSLIKQGYSPCGHCKP